MHRQRRWLTIAAAATISMTAGCTADPTTSAPNDAGTSPTAAASIAPQALDQALHDRLPDNIRQSGTVVAVNQGSYPPYSIVEGANDAPGGLLGDVSTAIGEILGLKIQHETVAGLATVLSGMQAGRYDLALDPNGDYPERHTQATFVDYIQEHVLFAVLKGNPSQINDLADVCGKRIAVLAGGSAEKRLNTESTTCATAGKPAVEVQSYQDSPASILSLKSGRSDAVFGGQGPLSYYVARDDTGLQLAAEGKDNGFGATFQGAMVPVDSPLAPILLQAIEKLYANGTYDAITAKWALHGNRLDKPGINRSTE